MARYAIKLWPFFLIPSLIDFLFKALYFNFSRIESASKSASKKDKFPSRSMRCGVSYRQFTVFAQLKITNLTRFDCEVTTEVEYLKRTINNIYLSKVKKRDEEKLETNFGGFSRPGKAESNAMARYTRKRESAFSCDYFNFLLFSVRTFSFSSRQLDRLLATTSAKLPARLHSSVSEERNLMIIESDCRHKLTIQSLQAIALTFL